MKTDVASTSPCNQPLSPRARRFVAEYLKDFNATRAAIRSGYSRRTARVQGPRLLTKGNIREAINQAGDHALKSSQGLLARALHELTLLAFFDPASVLDQNGHVRPVRQLSPQARRCLTFVEIRHQAGGQTVIGTRTQPLSKLAALESVAKLSMILNYLGHPTPASDASEPEAEKLPITVFHDAIRETEALNEPIFPPASESSENEPDPGEQ